MCGKIRVRSQSVQLPKLNDIEKISIDSNIKVTKKDNLFIDETKKNTPNKALFENRGRSNTSIHASSNDLDFINDSIDDSENIINKKHSLTEILESSPEELAGEGLLNTKKSEITEDGFVVINGNEIKETKDELKKILINSIKELSKSDDINDRNNISLNSIFDICQSLDKIANLDGNIKNFNLVSNKSIDSFISSVSLLSQDTSDYNSIDNTKLLQELNNTKQEIISVFKNRDEYKTQFNVQIKELKLDKSTENMLNSLYDSFYKQYDILNEQIESKIGQLNNTNLPTTKREIGQFKALWNKTAIDTSLKLSNDLMKLNFDSYNKAGNIIQDDRPLINTMKLGNRLNHLKENVSNSFKNMGIILSQRQQEIKNEFLNDENNNKILSKKEIKDLMGDKKAGFFAKSGAKSKTIKELKNGNLRISSKNFQDRELLEVTLKQSIKNAEKTLESELKILRKELESSGIGKHKYDPNVKGEKYNKKEIDKLINAIREEMLNVLNESKPKQILQEQYTQNLNKKEWNIIEKNVKYTKSNGQTINIQSKMTPASKVFQNSNTDIKYEGIGGVSCFDRGREDHAVNLWTSELKTQDGKDLFKGLRHGINSAFTIKDKIEREKANDTRSQEIVLSALLSNKELLNKAMNRKPDEEELVLNLPSISLVTPTMFRGGTSKIWAAYDKEHDEAMMLKQQADSWNRIKNTIMSFNIDGKDVQIKVNPIQFNFGVNAGAVGALSKVIGGWSESDKYNEKAMQELLGYKSGEKINRAINGGIVFEYESNLVKEINRNSHQPKVKSELEKKRKQITEIAEQIKQIWNSESYKSDNHDAYKMPVRLLALSYLTGNIPAYNCKSGKDRTSQLDVEVKNFLTQLELDNTLQGFGLEKDDRFKKNFSNFVVDAGNFEVQKANVGAGGFKLSGVDSLKERIGGKENQRIQQGLGKYNKA